MRSRWKSLGGVAIATPFALLAVLGPAACGSDYGASILQPQSVSEGGTGETPNVPKGELGQACANGGCSGDLVCVNDVCAIASDAATEDASFDASVEAGPTCSAPKKDLGGICGTHDECCSGVCNGKRRCAAAQCITMTEKCSNTEQCCVGLRCPGGFAPKCVPCIPSGEDAEKTYLGGFPIPESCCSLSASAQGKCR